MSLQLNIRTAILWLNIYSFLFHADNTENSKMTCEQTPKNGFQKLNMTDDLGITSYVFLWLNIFK